ncbi:PQ loop repeat protein [Aspergillus bombycis]|uniref:PQ loop repeat protein n=1 Tax=Aspergillus bombycis TaxID=109264 RepID=A0A1F8A4F6_9EURO|nr:PQ loop repeat protein [Aspergillus bombycis]OGM46178.1 PQ loop repeat protein [Aspergillus bombycis]
MSPSEEPPISSKFLLRNRTNESPSPTSAQKLFNSLKKEIVETNGPSYLEREGIPPDIGYILALSLSQDGEVESKSVIISYNPTTETLNVKMPSHTHASIMPWAVNEFTIASISGFWSITELDEVSLTGSPGMHNFPAPWQNVYLEPDLVFVYSASGARDLPTVVFEVGYWQSWPSQIQNKNLWLEAASSVNVVVLIKWNQCNNSRVAGYLELFRRGSPPTHIQIFPTPAPGTAPQTLPFYRQDFYPPGAVLPAGRNATDVWHWNMDNFRMRATSSMLLPQIWKNWRRHDSESLSAAFFLSWAMAGVPLGVYNIADNFNIALQVQPNILIFLSLFTWSQCKYYGDNWSLKKAVPVAIAIGAVLGGTEAGLVFALRVAYKRGERWPSTLMAILSAVLLAAGVLRHYVDMFRTRSDAGLSLKFALLDASGDVASILSVIFQPSPSILGLVIYGTEFVIWLGLMIILLYFRAAQRRKARDIRADGPSDGVSS